MDKQIEEMAKVICTHINPCKNCTEYDFGYCKFLGLCEKLYNAGYRKIHEGAVVLTEAEYNDLLSDEIKTIERDIAEYWATENVDVVAKEMHKIGYRKLDDHAICVLRKAKCLEERLRKETAEELLDEIDYESNGQTKPITDLFRKKYGV